MKLQNNQKFLFIGDSITDAGRTTGGDLDSMGFGYANMVSAFITANYPDKNIEFINRGINGNRAIDLVGRWEEDCLQLEPDWICILIGINDTWRKFDSKMETTAEEFEANYRTILDSVKTNLPNTKVIMLEPFLLHIQRGQKSWRKDLNPKIAVVNKLAETYADIFIPLDELFQQMAEIQPGEVWLGDGVHPTQVGAMLIAKQVLREISI